MLINSSKDFCYHEVKTESAGLYNAKYYRDRLLYHSFSLHRTRRSAYGTFQSDKEAEGGT